MLSAIEQKPSLEHISDVFESLQVASRGLRKESIQERRKRLQSLRNWIKANRSEIQQAIYNDFRKPGAEIDTTEIFPALDEIKLALDNLERWTKPKKVDAPITMLGTRAL